MDGEVIRRVTVRITKEQVAICENLQELAKLGLKYTVCDELSLLTDLSCRRHLMLGVIRVRTGKVEANGLNGGIDRQAISGGTEFLKFRRLWLIATHWILAPAFLSVSY